MKDLLDWRAERPLLRYLPLAVVPVLLLASTFPGQFRVPLSYWLLAMAAAGIFAFGQRWPLPVSLAVSALAVPMLHAPAWGLSGLVPYLGAVALADVVMRSTGWRVAAIATAGWALAVLLGQWDGHDPSLPRAAVLVQAGTYIGLPLLLGLYLRGQRTLAATMRDRAVEAENRRDAAELHVRVAERSAMARELHDLVAHHIAAILLRIGVAKHVVAEADPRITAVLDDVRGTATDALGDIRRLLAALRDPDLGDVALVDSGALRTEMAAALDRVRAAGFTVVAETTANLDRLDAIGRLTLLRLVQESMTNVMKHGDRAEPVRIDLDDFAPRGLDPGNETSPGFAPAGRIGGQDATAQSPPPTAHDIVRRGGVRLRITNGMRAPSGESAEGHGIIGMRERIELADGALEIGAAGGHWRLEAHLPTATGQYEIGSPTGPVRAVSPSTPNGWTEAARQTEAATPARPFDGEAGAVR